MVQREAAQKWAGLGYETLASVLLKNHFVVDVPVAIDRTDFDPRPNVDCVLLRLRRRARPCVEPRGFEALVRRGFGNGRGTVARNLGGRVRPAAVGGAGIGRDALPHELSFEQWVALM